MSFFLANLINRNKSDEIDVIINKLNKKLWELNPLDYPKTHKEMTMFIFLYSWKKEMTSEEVYHISQRIPQIRLSNKVWSRICELCKKWMLRQVNKIKNPKLWWWKISVYSLNLPV